MYRVKRKKGGVTNKLLKNLEQLDDQSVEVGHFESQGDHTSGMTYPELLALYFFGVGEDDTKRWPRETFVQQELDTGRINSEIAGVMKQWSKFATSPVAEDILLEGLGEKIRDSYKEVFGKVGPLMPSDSDGTPMLETGELRDSTAYKTSKQSIPKEG